MFVIFTPEENDFLSFKRDGSGIESYQWTGLVSFAETFIDKEIAIIVALDIQEARLNIDITRLSIQVLSMELDFTIDFQNPVFEIKAKHKFSDN